MIKKSLNTVSLPSIRPPMTTRAQPAQNYKYEDVIEKEEENEAVQVGSLEQWTKKMQQEVYKPTEEIIKKPQKNSVRPSMMRNMKKHRMTEPP